VNELLEQLHRKGKDHQGSIVLNIYKNHGVGSSDHFDHGSVLSSRVWRCILVSTRGQTPCARPLWHVRCSLTYWGKRIKFFFFLVVWD